MKVEHTLTVMSLCPHNAARDIYEMTLRFERFIQLEEILGMADDYTLSRIWQEDLTQEFADHFQCQAESHGIHSGVKTKVVCDASPGERVHENHEKTRKRQAKKLRRFIKSRERK